jgi:integrase
MGNIRVTEAGYLYFDFFCKGVRCREYTELKNTPENMKLMNEAMRKIEGEINLGTFNYSRYFPGSRNKLKIIDTNSGSSGLSFEAYADRWYKNNQVAWKPSTRRDFDSILNLHLIPYFKGKTLTEITKSMIKEFRTHLSELKGKKGKMSNKRINNILCVLRLMLNEAAEEFDFTNPFVNIRPLTVKKPEIMPFSLDEVLIFLGSVRDDFYNYYAVRFFTGMRTAEIDGLKWKYIDFINKKIIVRETWERNQWVSPKTESSIRDIDMSKVVEDALLDQKQKTGDEELVFSSKGGRPLDYNNVSKRIWYPTLKKAGLVLRNPYQTRHTAATLWLASGENPEWVSRQLGHSNSEMLFRVYSKFIPNLTRQDGSAFEAILSKKLDDYKKDTEEEEE